MINKVIGFMAAVILAAPVFSEDSGDSRLENGLQFKNGDGLQFKNGDGLQFKNGDGLQFKNGDRVTLVGDAFLESEQLRGEIETAISRTLPEHSLVFRNLAWSGDNPFGHARVGFDAPQTGVAKLRRQIAETKPTLVILAYGMTSSFDGQSGLPRFESGLNSLLDYVASIGARAALVSPIHHEKLPKPLPDPSAHNKQLELYVAALRRIAETRKIPFADIYTPTKATKKNLTWNGIHPTPEGYRVIADMITAGFGLKPRAWTLDFAVGGDNKIAGSELDEVFVSQARVHFHATDLELPPAPFPDGRSFDSGRVLRVTGLASGQYGLWIDDKLVLSASAGQLAKGLNIAKGPEFDQVATMREEIKHKDFLYFCRYRPQNNTYLFLFRKHEQGKLAGEIPDFDPLLSASQKKIDALKKPTSHCYNLRLLKEGEGK